MRWSLVWPGVLEIGRARLDRRRGRVYPACRFGASHFNPARRAGVYRPFDIDMGLVSGTIGDAYQEAVALYFPRS